MLASPDPILAAMRESIQLLLRTLSDSTAELCKPLKLNSTDRITIGLHTTDGFRVVVNSTLGEYPSYPAIAWFSRLPECRRHPNAKKWNQCTLKDTDFNAIIICALWPIEQIQFETQSAKIVFFGLIARFTKQHHKMLARAEYFMNGVMPATPNNWLEHSENPLSDYQKVAVYTSIGEECSAIFAEQGTGKTPIVINRVCYESQLIRERENRFMLGIVVAPKNVRENWLTEFRRFATLPGRVTVLRGSSLDRLGLVREAVARCDEIFWSIVICSYETLYRSRQVLTALNWDMGVLDESHMIKEHSTQRAKMAIELRQNCRQRVIMTGTPVCNSPRDLYTQLEFLAQGMSGMGSFSKFKSFYEQYSNHGDGIKSVDGFKNLPMIQERVNRIAFVITKKVALPQLPAKIHDIKTVEMSDAQWTAYRDMQTGVIAEVENAIEAGEASGMDKKMTANHILTMLLRLTQITSGFVKYDAVINEETGETLRESEIAYFDPVPKAEALAEIIGELEPDEKAIVWASFTADIEMIKHTMDCIGVKCVVFTGDTSDADRIIAEREFNCNPACRVFIGNAIAGGTGLNLRGYDAENPEESETDCTTVVYYSQNWSMSARTQSEDRAHRRGTRRPVRYIDLIVPGTIDQEIRKAVVEKRRVAETVQDIRQVMATLLQLQKGEDDD